MLNGTIDIKEFHWMMDALHSIDVGLLVLDQEYCVSMWNRFMENHSGKLAESVIGHNLFDVFPEIPQKWFKRKAETVTLLKNRAFTTWEQRPYLVKFNNYRPITGSADYMYQNVTFIPLVSTDTQVNHIAVIIYDVTDIAVGKNALEEANRQLEGLSRTDRLTQLNNRGYWEECLIREFQRYTRTRQHCTLVMFDIDHFKKVNDTYGHQAGDEVIRMTAKALLDCMRATDIAGRYGGEEFAAILIDTTAEKALVFAERLRTKIEQLTIIYGQHSICYTISLGIAEGADDVEDYKQWLQRADEALYASKEGGRNKATIYAS